MALFNAAERQFVEAVGTLAHCNPFTPERIECERAALGSEFDEREADWNIRFESDADHPNLARLLSRAETLLEQARSRIARRAGDLSDSDVRLYEDLLLTTVYHRRRRTFDELIREGTTPAGIGRAASAYKSLLSDIERHIHFADRRLPMAETVPHLFAGFFQIRRAFENIFRLILGVSRPAIQLRAEVWQSIFTHDMRRYRRVLYARMADFTTLVNGPSGTGKELVAQAIGSSRYIPYDVTKGRFHGGFAGSFFPVNLSALSPTLIESELFGHKRGSFTGAIADREGWLEVCPPQGTVFLDEIGEVDTGIQVKLLRVLQSREFVRLGETTARQFRGKIIAATNRILAEELRDARFRHDFYYRLCSDVVTVPTLKERIADNPAELRHLVASLAQRATGEDAHDLTNEILNWIETRLGLDYAWPGNVRELEQCVRNILIRRSYIPAQSETKATADQHDALFGAIAEGRLTADELLKQYCTLVFASTKSYEATARKLKLDRRTVRAKVDPAMLEHITATMKSSSQ